LLLLILLPFREFGIFLLIGTGLFTFVTSIFLANDIKKLENSITSRIISIVLISLIFYSAIILFYGLGNIGTGDMGLVFMFTLFSYLIFLALSLTIGIILVIINKKMTIENKPNRILSTFLIIILVLLFYSFAVSGIARITGSPGLCSMHIEMKSNSFIFVKGMQDSCILRVALDTSNVEYCKIITDIGNEERNICILNVARNLRDVDICYQISTSSEWLSKCVEYITDRKSPGYYYEDGVGKY